MISACEVNLDGRREIIGMGIGESEAKAFWLAFLLSLEDRGLEGVKLVISGSHRGLKAAIQQVFSASWQRCRGHFMRNVLSRVSRANQSVVRAALQQVFVQTDEKSAHATWCEVAGQLEKSNPAVTEMMDEAEADVLAYFGFPKAHRVKIHATKTLERLNKEVKRRANVVGIFPNEESITWLPGAVLTEQNEEWLLQNRYLPEKTCRTSAPFQADKKNVYRSFTSSGVPFPHNHCLSSRTHYLSELYGVTTFHSCDSRGH